MTMTALHIQERWNTWSRGLNVQKDEPDRKVSSSKVSSLPGSQFTGQGFSRWASPRRREGAEGCLRQARACLQALESLKEPLEAFSEAGPSLSPSPGASSLPDSHLLVRGWDSLTATTKAAGLDFFLTPAP